MYGTVPQAGGRDVEVKCVDVRARAFDMASEERCDPLMLWTRSGRSALSVFEFQCIRCICFVCVSFVASTLVGSQRAECNHLSSPRAGGSVFSFFLSFLPLSFRVYPHIHTLEPVFMHAHTHIHPGTPTSSVEPLSHTSPRHCSTHTNIGTPRAWHLFSHAPPHQCTHMGRGVLKPGYFEI